MGKASDDKAGSATLTKKCTLTAMRVVTIVSVSQKNKTCAAVA